MDFRKFDLYSPPCPICDGESFQRLVGNDRYGMRLQTAGCLRCGLVQTWPRPTPAVMAVFYRDRYRGYYQSISAPDDGYAAAFNKNERLAYTAGLIERNAMLAPDARVLDVGCAEGSLFSELAKTKTTLSFVGIEPSAAFSAYARERTGCSTYPDLDALSASGELAFDLIVVNHVLEHVDDPVVFLARLRSLLAPEGRIYVDVPDAARYTTPESLHIAHLFHFSPRTLEMALQRSGFRAIQMSCHQPPHHPLSVWCVAVAGDNEGGRIATSAESERATWHVIGALRNKLPFYLLARKIGGNGLAKKTLRAMRRLRGWIADR